MAKDTRKCAKKDTLKPQNFEDGRSMVNQHTTKEFFFEFLRGMSLRQILGGILESKVVQKLSLEKKFSLKTGLLN